MNSIMVIEPYFDSGMWMFDDARASLTREAFIAGSSEIITAAIANAGIPFADARRGFVLTFSPAPFPGHQLALRKASDDMGGAWYETNYTADTVRTTVALGAMRGWLCPALFKYFDRAPEFIYAHFAPKPKDTNGAA